MQFRLTEFDENKHLQIRPREAAFDEGQARGKVVDNFKKHFLKKQKTSQHPKIRLARANASS
jgi:hypothetical protein